MKNLIHFLIKNGHWLLFFFLTALSFIFIVQNNEFQKSKYLSKFDEVAGRIYFVSNQIQSYMDLKKNNAELLNKVALLEMELQAYQKEQNNEEKEADAHSNFEIDSIQYNYIPVNVINNQIAGIGNYITFDKGSLDGIEPDMGVLSTNGIVGVITNVSAHFSRAISVLNPNFRPSCKIKKNNYFGPLVWDGKDVRYTYLEELPRHMEFAIGDTIVTSGFSTKFPGDIPVGIVVGSRKMKDDNYNSLKVELFSNLANLKQALVVKNKLKNEQLGLEGAVSSKK